jgi:hypothetical protein
MKVVSLVAIAALASILSNLVNIINNGPTALRKLTPLYGFAGRHPFAVGLLAYAGLVAVFINFNTLDVQALNAAPQSEYFFFDNFIPLI